MPTTWPGVTVSALALAGLGAVVWLWSARTGWGGMHVLAVAAAPLVVNAGVAFSTEPLGSPDPVIKYAVNAVLAAGVALLLLIAARRTHAEAEPGPAADLRPESAPSA